MIKPIIQDDNLNKNQYRWLLRKLNSLSGGSVNVVTTLPEPSAEIENQLYVLMSGDTATLNVVVKEGNDYVWKEISSNAGISSVIVTVDSTSGNPQGTATFEDGVLTLAFTGIKGEQGNTGSSVDYPFELVNNVTEGGVDKALSAEQGKLLKQIIDTLATKQELAQKANVDGYYERLTAGSAERLIAPSDVVDDSLEQTTGGNAEVANGLARINEVKGKSQVWNQQVNDPNCETAGNYTRTNPSGSSLISGEGYGELAFNSGTAVQMSVRPNLNGESLVLSNQLLAGHKYYYSIFLKRQSETECDASFGEVNTAGSPRGNGYSISFTPLSTEWSKFAFVSSANVLMANYIACAFGVRKGNEDDSVVVRFKNCQFIDLTLLGIDTLTTPEQVEAWLAKNKGLKPYYPYDAGSILNAKLIGLESYEKNLLNPSTNKARIIGRYSDTYGNYYGITGTYDSISFTSDLGETTAITPDSEGKFVLTEPGEISVVNPGADCAVFIWWDGRQTDYTPYKTDKAYIDLTHIYGKLNGTGELVQVFPEGARGVNSVKDRLYVEDGEVKAKVACGKVDLGTLDWTQQGTNTSGKYRFKSSAVSDIKADTSILLIPKYNKANTYACNTGYALSGKTVFIYDEQYVTESATTFKAALSGVPLIYELATPLIYTDLVYQGSEHFEDGTPVQLPVDYEVDDYGMEAQILGSDSVPAELSVRYQMDAAEAIDTLQTEMAEVQEVTEPTNLISAASMDNFLSSLGTAMSGTWTKTWNATLGVFEFSFVPNE